MNEGSPSWYWASRAAWSIIAQPWASTVTAHVCRSYRKRIVDLAGTQQTMCCCFRTATTVFTWTSRRTARRSRNRYGIPLLATDAEWRPGLDILLSGHRLFQQYVVNNCAKMEQQRLNYVRFKQNSLRMLTLFWRMTDIAPIDVCSILCMWFVVGAIEHDK